MSETPDTGFHEVGVESLTPRRKLSALTITAIVLAIVVVVVGAGVAAGVIIFSQQQQLNDLTELVGDGTGTSPTADAGADDAEARAGAVSDLERSIADGEDTYTDTDGRVSDESIRDALRSAIDAGDTVLADPDASVEVIEAARAAIDSAAGAAAGARGGAWADINGTWCYHDTECRTITEWSGRGGTLYAFEARDGNGCLTGYSGTSGEPRNARVAYCPPGSAFPLMTDPAGDCHMTEDVTRERLYMYQDCSDPYYCS